MRKKKIAWGQVILNAIFIIFAICYIVPFLLCISISFSDEKSLAMGGYSLIPRVFSLESYELVFRNPSQILR